MRQTLLRPLPRNTGLITPNRSTGQSDSAEQLARLIELVRMQLLTSYVVRRGIEHTLQELEATRQEASSEGWDGYGARPINFDAYQNAKRFLESLPTTAPLPEIGADPDGDVALDWSFGPRRALSVSINQAGRCSFAWMRGQSTYHGTDWLDDGIPRSIAGALSELARDASQAGYAG